jgi:hypothetical protein
MFTHARGATWSAWKGDVNGNGLLGPRWDLFLVGFRQCRDDFYRPGAFRRVAPASVEDARTLAWTASTRLRPYANHVILNVCHEIIHGSQPCRTFRVFVDDAEILEVGIAIADGAVDPGSDLWRNRTWHGVGNTSIEKDGWVCWTLERLFDLLRRERRPSNLGGGGSG